MQKIIFFGLKQASTLDIDRQHVHIKIEKHRELDKHRFIIEKNIKIES